MDIETRAATLEDAPEISAIAVSSVGEGPIGIRTQLHMDAYTVFSRHPRTKGIVACAPDSSVVGYIFYRPQTVWLNGKPTRTVFSFNGAVHPDHRRKGVGRQLSRAVSQAALDMDVHTRFTGVAWTNVASKGLVNKMGFMVAGSYVRAMTLTRRRRPRLPAGVRVRRAESFDLAAWATAANGFYREHNFWQPLSGELLAD